MEVLFFFLTLFCPTIPIKLVICVVNLPLIGYGQYDAYNGLINGKNSAGNSILTVVVLHVDSIILFFIHVIIYRVNRIIIENRKKERERKY